MTTSSPLLQQTWQVDTITDEIGTEQQWLQARIEFPAADNAAALAAADWLCLAAAPTFAVMALLTGVLGGGRLNMLCSAVQDASLLSGMVPMYLLMSALHSAPWLKLLSGRRHGARRSHCPAHRRPA